MYAVTARIATRERLPDRRASTILSFEHEGHRYRATVSFFPDGRPGEIFLDTGKDNTPLQTAADTAAILTSLALQHGIDVATLRHSIAGPIAKALDLIGVAAHG